ncbi:hypothetical protein Tco_0595049 [Tanacetum coccineum]
MEVLRIVLQLPKATKNEQQEFVLVPDFKGIANFLRDLNYDEREKPFVNISTFQKKNVPQPWQMLLTIINRCKTPKATTLNTARLYVKLLIEYFMLKHEQIARRVNADRHTPDMDEPGTHRSIRTKGTRKKRMAGTPKSNVKNGKVAKTIEEDDNIKNMFHDFEEEELQDMLDTLETRDDLDSKAILSQCKKEGDDEVRPVGDKNDEDDDEDMDDANGSKISLEDWEKKQTPHQTPTRSTRTPSPQPAGFTNISHLEPTNNSEKELQPPSMPTKTDDKPLTPPPQHTSEPDAEQEPTHQFSLNIYGSMIVSQVIPQHIIDDTQRPTPLSSSPE